MKFSIEALKQTKAYADPRNQKLVAEATGSSRPLGPVVAKEPEHHTGERAPENPVLEVGKVSLGYCVTIIAFCRRKMDGHDNFRFACKPLVDRITKSLGFKSDDDERLEWRYHQIASTGKPGCIVKIEKQNSKRRAEADD